ncbi:MAG TPA: PD-(D/E)XK nuclease family protein, partial [Solirubrobacteraceae bacterium]
MASPAQTGAGGVAADVAEARIRVSELGEFIRFQSCGRRFKLSYDRRAAARRLPFFERLFSPLDPILQQAGNQAEDAWQQQLRDAGYRELAPAETVADEDGGVRPQRTPWARFAEASQRLEPGETAYGREITVDGAIGSFRVEGAIDFVLIDWPEGQLRVRLVEGKSSRRDRTYHRIQVVCYRMLLRQLIDATPLEIGGQRVDPGAVEVVIARIEEDTGQPQLLAGLEPIAETDREEADIERLLAADGRVAAIVATDLDELPFQLASKCDGCVFNIDCLSESGRQRRLELLGIEPSTSAALREAGVMTIDELSVLDLDGAAAAHLRRVPGFTESLARLRERASARCSTLPRGDQDPDQFEVASLPAAGQSQLPEHLHDGEPLVRIYLAVDYDYTENRVGALTAHITRSTHELELCWEGPEGRRQPDPVVRERLRVGEEDEEGRLRFRFEDQRPVDPAYSRTVVEEMSTPWTGRSETDTGAERLLLQRFFSELVEAVEELCAPAEECRLHFYVWQRGEITRLVEACARTDSRLLSHLRELLGARESLEQLIFSSVGEEIDSRFGLGWTGRGLIVAASLGWFGQRFHWTRTVRAQPVELDRVFTQDLFDFKTTLGLEPDGSWSANPEQAAQRHRFEIRSRNFDTL